MTERFLESKEYAFYNNKFKDYGEDPKSLGWQKISQVKRFKKITEMVELQGQSILDIGAGFLDFAKYIAYRRIKIRSYSAIEPMPDFYKIGEKVAKRINQFESRIYLNNWEEYVTTEKYDIVICIGVLNLAQGNNYKNLEKFILKYLKFSKDCLIISILKANNNTDNTDSMMFFYDVSKVSDICNKHFLKFDIATDHLPHDLILKIEM